MLVYVHGNCQALAIARMLAPAFPQWRIEFYEVFQPKIIDEIERYHSLVASADIIIAQPIHAGYRGRDDLSIDWIRSHAKPGTPVVTFPSMYFGGQLVGWTSLAIPGYGMPYVDPVLIKMVLAGLSVEQITDAMLSPHLYDGTFIDQEIEASIAEIGRRENADGVDAPLSPFLQEYGRSAQLFHVINHPCRPALAYVANEILTHLGYAKAVPDVGEDYIRFPHVPCSPSVARFLDADIPAWSVPDGNRFHLPDKAMEPREYILRAVFHLRGFDPDVLRGCLNDHRAKPFLDRAEDASPMLKNLFPRQQSPDWREWYEPRTRIANGYEYFDTSMSFDRIEVQGRGIVSPLAVKDEPMWRPVHGN